MMHTRVRVPLYLSILVLFSSACAQAGPASEVASEIVESTPASTQPAATNTPLPTEEIVRGTVSIRHSWDETQLPALAGIIKSFQTFYPDVAFDVLYIPADDLLQRFEMDTREGLGPTLLLGPAEWGPELFQKGLISEIGNAVKPADLRLLNQAALEEAHVGSALIGLPYSISGVLLYRNKDVITITPNTFDDLITLAQTSTQGATIGSYLERSFFYSGAHLEGLGGKLIDENNLPAFNNGKGVEWLGLLKDMEQAGPTNYFSDEDLERFKLGKVGWIIDGSWEMRDLADAIGAEKLAIDPWPTYSDGKLSGYVLADNVYLSARANEQDRNAAEHFINYLTAQEAQFRIAETGRIPASLAVKLKDPPYGELVNLAIEALKNGTSYPVNPAMPVYNLNLDIALRGFFEGALTAEQALQQAQDSILAELAKATPTPIP